MLMDSNDEVTVTPGGLNDEEGQPVPGAHVTGYAATLLDGSDASAVVTLVPAADNSSCVVKSMDVEGSVLIIANTANGAGQPGGDQTGQLDIGAPNVAGGSLAFSEPVART
jgi:hypothetical protein